MSNQLSRKIDGHKIISFKKEVNRKKIDFLFLKIGLSSSNYFLFTSVWVLVQMKIYYINSLDVPLPCAAIAH